MCEAPTYFLAPAQPDQKSEYSSIMLIAPPGGGGGGDASGDAAAAPGGDHRSLSPWLIAVTAVAVAAK